MDFKTRDDSQLKQGYLYAVRLLTASKKSASELSKRLNKKGYDPQVTAAILEALRNQGILNDRKMVDETIHWAKQAKRYGKKRVALELRKKGIGQTVIDAALVAYTKEEEREIAYPLAEVRWNKLQTLEPLKRKKRVFDFLMSRGFDFEITREIIDRLNSKQNDENI